MTSINKLQKLINKAEDIYSNAECLGDEITEVMEYISQNNKRTTKLVSILMDLLAAGDATSNVTESVTSMTDKLISAKRALIKGTKKKSK